LVTHEVHCTQPKTGTTLKLFSIICAPKKVCALA
jgi:hypothetical protein